MSEHECLLGIQLSKEYKFEFWLPFFYLNIQSCEKIRTCCESLQACLVIWKFNIHFNNSGRFKL